MPDHVSVESYQSAVVDSEINGYNTIFNKLIGFCLTTQNITEPLSFKVECSTSAAHPCTDGHFPGQPVVPAGYILSQISHLTQGQIPALKLQGFKKVKFLAPVPLDKPCYLLGQVNSKGMLTFELESTGTVILKGIGHLTLNLKTAGKNT